MIKIVNDDSPVREIPGYQKSINKNEDLITELKSEKNSPKSILQMCLIRILMNHTCN